MEDIRQPLDELHGQTHPLMVQLRMVSTTGRPQWNVSRVLSMDARGSPSAPILRPPPTRL